MDLSGNGHTWQFMSKSSMFTDDVLRALGKYKTKKYHKGVNKGARSSMSFKDKIVTRSRVTEGRQQAECPIGQDG